MELIIVLVFFALVVGLLVSLPMLQEFRQIIVIVACLLMILYVGNHLGYFHGHVLR